MIGHFIQWNMIFSTLFFFLVSVQMGTTIVSVSEADLPTFPPYGKN